MSFHTPAHKVAFPMSNEVIATLIGPDVVDGRIPVFVAAVQAKTDEYTTRNFPNSKPDVISAPFPWGAKYIRIVRADVHGTSRSVHCFIDRSNGDILKAAGWKAPAKHARGNIFANDVGMSCMEAYGPKYL